MKVKYVGSHDAVTIGRVEIQHGEAVDIKDIGLTEPEGKALVDRGDFTSGSYKAKKDAEVVPAEDFASTPPAPNTEPAVVSEEE